MKLKKHHWLSLLLAFALSSGIVMHMLLSTDEVPQLEYYGLLNQNQSQGQSQAQVSASSDSHQQVSALTLKLAELQSHMLRLNALGERLAAQANIPADEFNFGRPPASGGPMSKASDDEFNSLAQLLSEVDNFEVQFKHEEKQLELLESVTLGHHISNTSYLSGRPISAGWLSSYYGIRKDPFTGQAAMHKGVDFAGKEDADIITTAAGVVSWAGARYGYGQLIEINHGVGLKTRYGHNKTLLVKVGDVVNKGQVIAFMGSTGRSTGPHVHYEILRNEQQIDPIKYVYRKAK